MDSARVLLAPLPGPLPTPPSRGEGNVAGLRWYYPDASWGARAFSLMEMLVSVTLLALIIVGLMAMFNQTQKAFRAGVGQVDVLEGGRSVMEAITREMAQIMPTYAGGVPNLYAMRPGPASPLVLQLIGAESYPAELHEIFFLSRLNNEWIGTGYLVSNVVAGAGPLYRYVSSGPAAAVSTLSSNFFLAPLTDPEFHRVADGVVHLRLLPYDEQGRVMSFTNSANVFIAANGFVFRSNAVPAYVDLELAVLEPQAFEQFKSIPNAIVARQFLERQAGRIHYFRQRVSIHAGTP